MGKKFKLREAINLIWETVKITEEQDFISGYPYLFVVGAGVSAPEILSASGIIKHCQEKIKDLYKDSSEELESIFEKSNSLKPSSAEYYSYWFGQAYKNKIHRQQYLKQIIGNARISTSNLLLAQILNNKKIATTVITPNFDNHLLKSLNLLGNYNVFSANNVLDNIALNKDSKEIQIMHVHGTYEFYDCCNLENEITSISHGKGIRSTAGTIEEFFKSQTPIVIGYSGWEDDVIMSKLKERLQYAPLPYNMIWFCFSINDYESLPEWLKISEDVIFVLPDEDNNMNDEREKVSFLPAEDVFGALITKFGFKAPNLFSNPIKYYIELIDGFLPQNIDSFPIKIWKRRLDLIEAHLGDVAKTISELDDAAARKDIITITAILKNTDNNYIYADDLEHIVGGVVLPLLNSKNRIEDEKDVVEFIAVVLDLLLIKIKVIENGKMKEYLIKILDFISNYSHKMGNENAIMIYNKIIDICTDDLEFEEMELAVLGMKSECVDGDCKIELQNEIINRGQKKIANAEISRLVLVAVIKQIKTQGTIAEQQKKLMEYVLENHEKNKKILTLYYRGLIEFYDSMIYVSNDIDNLIKEISKNDLSKDLLLHARLIQCKNEEDSQLRTELACKAVDEYEYENENTVKGCMECFNYAVLLGYIISSKEEEKNIDPKYIDYAIQLCDKIENCSLVAGIIMEAFLIYVLNIQSQYEKRELCKKSIDVCWRCELYDEWTIFSGIYTECLTEKDREAYILANEKYRIYNEAVEKMGFAIKSYTESDIEICGDLLLEVSEDFDNLFNEKYNPALINICFMLRRDEISELTVSVMDVLDEITWMDGDAFFHINKALAYINLDDWKTAREEIAQIDWNLDEALEWWKQENVVGKVEKYTVLLLLAIENKLNEDSSCYVETEEFWNYCIENLILPSEIQKELENIKGKYINS